MHFSHVLFPVSCSPGGCERFCTLCHWLPDRVTLQTRVIQTPRASCRKKGLLLGVFVLAQLLIPSRNMICKRVIHLSVFGFIKMAGILSLLLLLPTAACVMLMMLLQISFGLQKYITATARCRMSKRGVKGGLAEEEAD